MKADERVESVLAEMRNFGPVTDAQRFAWANRIALAHARAAQDAAFGAWVRATMQASGPIKTVSGKDVYPVLLPPVDRGAGLDAAIDAAIAARQQGEAHEA